MKTFIFTFTGVWTGGCAVVTAEDARFARRELRLLLQKHRKFVNVDELVLDDTIRAAVVTWVTGYDDMVIIDGDQ